MHKLTQAVLIPPDRYDALILIPGLKKSIAAETNFLCIYALENQFTRITCYPVATTKIWKFQISIESITSDIIERIGLIFKSLSPIHTTGVCQYEGHFLIENYIVPPGATIQFKSILMQIKAIPGVLDTNLELITLSK
jgi:hypothetical protein